MTAFDRNGTPMRLTVTVFPTDRNEFIVNVGDVPDPPRARWRNRSQARKPETLSYSQN